MYSTARIRYAYDVWRQQSRMTEMPRVAVGGPSKLGARAGCCPVSCSPSTTALRVLLWKFGYNEPRCLPTSPTGSSRRL